VTLARLSEALGLGADPEAVLAAVRRVYDEVDAEVAARTKGIDLPCKAGCDACCHESVFVSAPEWLLVAAQLLDEHPAEGRRSIVDEMRVLAERFEDELELLETIPPGAERDEVAARVKFRCPLLTNSGQCSVYASRELNGRTFGQTWQGKRGHPFGCELTHDRLRVLPDARLFDAVDARRKLAAAFPAIDFVHVFPWWFDRYGDYLL
jgi:Fe-S-cluster containining protein